MIAPNRMYEFWKSTQLHIALQIIILLINYKLLLANYNHQLHRRPKQRWKHIPV